MWKQIAIEKLVKDGTAEIKTGPFGTQLAASDYVEHGTPVINVRNIGSGILREEKLEYINEDTTKRLSDHLLSKGDIVFGRKGAVERHVLISEEQESWLQGSDCIRLRISDTRIINRFVSYYFLTEGHQKWMQNQGSHAATMASLNQDIINRIWIPLPPFSIQQRIVSILSSYDELIENNNKRIAILEQIAEQVYKEWFVRMRFPGHEKVKMMKGVPEGWEIKSLGHLVNITMGQSPPSEYYNESGDGLPFHQGVGNYGDRFPEHLVYCSSEGRMAEEGDILFSVRAPVGRINIANTKLIIGRGLAAINHKKGLNNYLFYLLKSIFSKEDLIGNGSIFNSVGRDELEKVKLYQPSNDLDKRFNDFILPIDKEIEILTKKNINLRKTRDLLLPRLISGKLSVEKAEGVMKEEMTV